MPPAERISVVLVVLALCDEDSDSLLLLVLQHEENRLISSTDATQNSSIKVAMYLTILTHFGLYFHKWLTLWVKVQV